jgi:Family of unknown function (DUF5681)
MMARSDVGRGRPPKHSRFKRGISGNPRGRPKRKSTLLGEITHDVFNTTIEYLDDGHPKKATRHQLSLKALVKHALTGNVAAAEMLLKLRTQAQAGDVSIQKIVVDNWLPDHPGQTGEEKSRQHVNEADLESSGGQRRSGTGKKP